MQIMVPWYEQHFDVSTVYVHGGRKLLMSFHFIEPILTCSDNLDSIFANSITQRIGF